VTNDVRPFICWFTRKDAEFGTAFRRLLRRSCGETSLSVCRCDALQSAVTVQALTPPSPRSSTSFTGQSSVLISSSIDTTITQVVDQFHRSVLGVNLFAPVLSSSVDPSLSLGRSETEMTYTVSSGTLNPSIPYHTETEC